MKFLLLVKPVLYSSLIICCISIGCHRKAAPSGSSANNEQVTPLLSATEAAGGTTAPAMPVYTKPIIIVDSRGEFAVTEKDLPADASKGILNPSSARAFTPAQTKTLAYRYKYVPPRILYVPASLRKTSSRGTYYVYNKKFWYWKKSDGYFYLDENYYK